jgi:HsdM N-terminal domain
LAQVAQAIIEAVSFQLPHFPLYEFALLDYAPPRDEPVKINLRVLESWLWEAACVIRGPVDAPNFKDYILPLIFLKRVSDVFEEEIRDVEIEFGTRQKGANDFMARGVDAAVSMPPLRGWLISRRGGYTDAAPTELAGGAQIPSRDRHDQTRRVGIFVASRAKRPKLRRSGIAWNATVGTDFARRGVALAVSMPPLRGWLISRRGCYTDTAPTELARGAQMPSRDCHDQTCRVGIFIVSKPFWLAL